MVRLKQAKIFNEYRIDKVEINLCFQLSKKVIFGNQLVYRIEAILAAIIIWFFFVKHSEHLITFLIIIIRLYKKSP